MISAHLYENRAKDSLPTLRILHGALGILYEHPLLAEASIRQVTLPISTEPLLAGSPIYVTVLLINQGNMKNTRQA